MGNIPNPSSVGFWNGLEDRFSPLSSGSASLLLDLKLDWGDPEREVDRWLRFLISHLDKMYSHSHLQSALSVTHSFGWTICYNWELSLKSITSVFQSQELFSLLAVIVYARLPQCTVLSPSHRQDIKLQGTSPGSLLLGIPEKKLSDIFRLRQ